MTQAVRLLLLINLLATGLCVADEKPQSLAEQRKAFLQAEQYINQDRDAEYFKLGASLKTYPLYPYLHYQWLKKHLDDEGAVRAFLQEYPGSRYSQLLRQKWLRQLGERRQWPVFLANYRPTDDNELQCYAALAQYHTGEQQAALETAKQLWQGGNALPAACDPLSSLLKISPLFNRDLVWQRFQAALAKDNKSLAAQLLPLFPKSEQADIELWLKFHRQPALVMESGDWKRTYPLAGNLFAHAIGRWLDNDPAAAQRAWDAGRQHYSIPDDVAAATERRLALALALRHDDRAYVRLSQLAEKDGAAREWRVRAALGRQNWQQVLEATEALADEEKKQDRWRYWQGRADEQTGKAELALAVFQELAKSRSLYGFLAAEHLQLNQELTDRPVVVRQEELNQLQQQNEFLVAAELLAIERKAEAKKQWWHSIAGLDQHGLLVAAKLAQRWQWPAMGIFTVAKANDWDDMDLRFPLAYDKWIQEIAATQQLQPAMIFGLIRQESAFDELAESPAGAKGLMQLMPKTAQQLARNLKEEWRGEASLFNPELNIKYGSLYFKNLLRQFKGNPVLAAAAYNAGTVRVRRWLPEKHALPGDIWLELIPYKETRNYVATVLSYTLIYQQRLQKNAMKPADLLREVLPD